MHATNLVDSTRTLSVLERSDAEECKTSEATWLPVTWRSLQRWPMPIRSKTIKRKLSNDRVQFGTSPALRCTKLVLQTEEVKE